MAKADIMALISKIFGLYLLVRAFESLQYIGLTIVSLYMVPEDQRITYLLGGFIPLLLLLVGAFILIKWSVQIGILFCGEEPQISLEEDKVIEKETLQQVIYAGIGVFLVANALPKLTQVIIIFAVQGEKGIAHWAPLVSVVMQLLIGVLLFFRPGEIFGKD